MTSLPFNLEMTIVLTMAVVTLATRWGGVFVMSFVPINNRVQQFISAMSGSVLVAILAPIFVYGELGPKVALLATAAFMLVIRQPLVSISAGLIAVSLMRYFYLPS